jgi:glycosyltransferase involved in cell wall biosynthesis
MLSIIIPTLNEEDYLPLLLESIKKQNFKDYEIIVADNNSKDRTVEIAKNYNCQVVLGGLPPKARNEGVKVAQGDLFLFLDADVVLPNGSLETLLEEFKERKLNVASCLIKSQNKFFIARIYYNILYNFGILLLAKIRPSAMNFMLIKRKLHQEIGGFDETIKFGEDVDYLTRASKIGKFAILKSTRILASTRRFEKEGWLKTGLKYVFTTFYLLIRGPIKSDIFKYKFGHYKK